MSGVVRDATEAGVEALTTVVRGTTVNRHMVALGAGFLVLEMVTGVHVTAAQEKPSAVNIAVIDPHTLLLNANASKNIRLQADRIRAAYQQEIKGKEEEIDKLSQELAQQRSTLPEDVYQKRLRELRQKAANAQIELQERQAKLDGALRAASQKVTAAIEQVVEEIMKEQKLALVVTRSTVVGTPSVPDITQEALKRINQRASTVIIEVPK